MRSHFMLSFFFAAFVVAAQAQAANKPAKAAAKPAAAPAAAAAATPASKDVVATVNGEPIYAREFARDWSAFVTAESKRMTREQMTPQWAQGAKKMLLDQVIDRRLIMQEARKKDVAVPQKDVDATLARAKEVFKRDAKGKSRSAEEAEAAFKESLAAQNITEKEFKDNVRDDLRATLFTRQTLKANVKAPTEEQVRKLFDDVKAAMAKPEAEAADPEMRGLTSYFKREAAERVGVQHILLSVPEKATTDQIDAAAKKAADVKALLDKGASFGELAEKFSEDKATAANGGDAGMVVRGDLKDVDDMLFALPVGGISGVTRTQRGFQIFRIQEKRAATDIRYVAAKRYLAEYTARKAEKDALASFIDGLKKAAKIDIKADVSKPS